MVAKLAAGIALCDVAAEPLGPASLDRTQRTVLSGHQGMICAVRRPVAREH